MKTIVVITAVLLSGCGLANSDYLTYNFEKDKVMVATVGAEMMNTTVSRKNDVYGTVRGTLAQTLTYSGKQGNIIKIFYREASNDMARPAFTQELTYDITDDPIIVFRETKIRVLEATNSTIKFIVLASPSFQYKSGDKIEPKK